MSNDGWSRLTETNTDTNKLKEFPCNERNLPKEDLGGESDAGNRKGRGND